MRDYAQRARSVPYHSR